ncbi:putative proline-rich receptor-like protein kinase PERK11-like [Aphomia sociella]
MSHYPPPPGPPYQPPYDVYPPPPGSVTYVPTPVYMPVYPPQPPASQPPSANTYVTNIYQQPTPEPVNIVEHAENDIDWIQVTANTAQQYQHRALIAGKEAWDGSPLCVIRAHHSGELVPGKLAIKHRSAYIPHSGRELPVHNFELLLAKPYAVQWISSSMGRVPPGAIPAGNSHNAEPLYIARVKHRGSITPGKVHPTHNCCYISFGGSEIRYITYEVLCKVVG